MWYNYIESTWSKRSKSVMTIEYGILKIKSKVICKSIKM